MRFLPSVKLGWLEQSTQQYVKNFKIWLPLGYELFPVLF